MLVGAKRYWHVLDKIKTDILTIPIYIITQFTSHKKYHRHGSK